MNEQTAQGGSLDDIIVSDWSCPSQLDRIESMLTELLEIANRPKKTNNKRFIEYSADFDQIWAIYPKRANGNPKAKAYGAFLARLKDGKSVKAMLAGTRQYAAFCDAAGKTGTEWVMQASTFFGPDLRFEDKYLYLEPEKKPRTEAEWNEAGSKVNVFPRTGESHAEFQRRVQVALR